MTQKRGWVWVTGTFFQQGCKRVGVLTSLLVIGLTGELRMFVMCMQDRLRYKTQGTGPRQALGDALKLRIPPAIGNMNLQQEMHILRYRRHCPPGYVAICLEPECTSTGEKQQMNNNCASTSELLSNSC